MPTAVQNLDGTFNIKDVLIFAELPPGARGNERKIGKRWMEAAIKTAEFREQEQDYLPPLHILHHGQEQPIRAGHFRVTHVEKITYDGRDTFALLADLVDIPAEMFARVRSGEFPYRSVEIFAINAEPGDKEPPVINGLALLDTEEPFFRFPMLNSKTIDMNGAATFKGQGLDVIRADAGAVALFSKFPEGIMPKDAKVALKGAKDEPETIIDALRALGMHEMFEIVTPRGNDCSLSNYVILEKLGDYYNVEVEHGDTKTQKAMIDLLMQYINDPNSAKREAAAANRPLPTASRKTPKKQMPATTTIEN